MAYWFNLDTREVESDETRSPAANTLGPYETQAEAANALEHVRENNDKWDEEDRKWDDPAGGAWDDSDLED